VHHLEWVQRRLLHHDRRIAVNIDARRMVTPSRRRRRHSPFIAEGSLLFDLALGALRDLAPHSKGGTSAAPCCGRNFRFTSAVGCDFFGGVFGEIVFWGEIYHWPSSTAREYHNPFFFVIFERMYTVVCRVATRRGRQDQAEAELSRILCWKALAVVSNDAGGCRQNVSVRQWN